MLTRAAAPVSPSHQRKHRRHKLSIQESRRRMTVTVKTIHCDGPKHDGDTQLEFDAISVEHGSGSPFDGDTHHFCGFTCMKDWVLANDSEVTSGS